MTCDRFRAAVIGMESLPDSLAAWPQLQAHASSCESCRHWIGEFAAGAEVWRLEAGTDVAIPVMAATGGAPCDRARELLASIRDGALDPTDVGLLAAHTERCGACRSFGATVASISDELGLLAERDPGPGFAAGVLARTSRRPTATTWGDRWHAGWQRLVQRPRFAFEAAYVLTLCWLLLFGQPITALDWTTARVSAMARDTVPARVRVVQARVLSWRERVSADADRAVSAVATGREAVGKAASAAGRRAAAWWTTLTADLPNLLKSAWHAMLAWVQGFLTDLGGSVTEPDRPSARSSK